MVYLAWSPEDSATSCRSTCAKSNVQHKDTCWQQQAIIAQCSLSFNCNQTYCSMHRKLAVMVEVRRNHTSSSLQSSSMSQHQAECAWIINGDLTNYMWLQWWHVAFKVSPWMPVIQACDWQNIYVVILSRCCGIREHHVSSLCLSSCLSTSRIYAHQHIIAAKACFKHCSKLPECCGKLGY